MSRKLLALCIVLVLVVSAIPAAAQGDPVTVTWYIGLGTGGQPEQQEMQEAVVEQFNATHDDIKLEINVADYEVARDTLATLIASGQSPDIIGPIGMTGSHAFAGSYLDLEPIIEATGYDMSQFPEAAVDNYRTQDGLVGLPFATYPSFMWYRPALFDEAGLDYPPTAYGEPYADGDPWDWDKVRELSMLLTVDAEGYDATMEEFDPENVIQWGFTVLWSDPWGLPTHFGAASAMDEDGNAQMPEEWREFYHWFYSGIWDEYWIPNAAQEGSDLLAAGNPFASGNDAMAVTHLWYTCCIDDTEWQAAPMPANADGEITAKLHGDTFRILDSSAHPEEAFEVMAYLIGEASLDLLSVYGGMPAREEDAAEFFADLDEKYTQGVNWQVVIDSMAYSDSPSHEQWMPNFNKAKDMLDAFTNEIKSTPDLDIDARLDQLVEDLQAVFDEVEE